MNGHVNSDTYNGPHNNQDQISSDDVNNLHGKVASPSALNEKIDELTKVMERSIDGVKLDYERQINDLTSNHSSQIKSLEDKINVWRGFIISLIVAVIIMAVKLIFDGSSGQKQLTNDNLSQEITSKIKQEVNEAIKGNLTPQQKKK